MINHGVWCSMADKGEEVHGGGKSCGLIFRPFRFHTMQSCTSLFPKNDQRSKYTLLRGWITHPFVDFISSSLIWIILSVGRLLSCSRHSFSWSSNFLDNHLVRRARFFNDEGQIALKASIRFFHSLNSTKATMSWGAPPKYTLMKSF